MATKAVGCRIEKWLVPVLDEAARLDDVLPSQFLKGVVEKRLAEIAPLFGITKPGPKYRPPVAPLIRQAVLDRDGHQCTECFTTEGPFHLHHIMTLANGGTNEEVNLRTVCPSCHSKLHHGYFYNSSEAAEELHISTHRLWRLARQLIVGYKDGSGWSFNQKDIRAIRTYLRNKEALIADDVEQQANKAEAQAE